MAVTMEDVLKLLAPEEPNYAGVEALGAEGVPFLESLLHGSDPMLASKAAYAASLLPAATGHDVVADAARSDNPLLRVAAAGATRNLPTPSAAVVLADLVSDSDASVRRRANMVIEADSADKGADGGGGFSLAGLVTAINLARGTKGSLAGPAADRSRGSLLPSGPSPAQPAAPTATAAGDVSRGLMPGELPPGSGPSKPPPGRMPGEAL
ncbi:HEAT repeat domain-containing protein [Kitasatospora sp. NPDC004614]|uniref:HEAT repeat domain-containing protein n=1 Tax=unclassified Kitasatospora TaxID=2633591 RepID=UPI0036C4A376